MLAPSLNRPPPKGAAAEEQSVLREELRNALVTRDKTLIAVREELKSALLFQSAGVYNHPRREGWISSSARSADIHNSETD